MSRKKAEKIPDNALLFRRVLGGQIKNTGGVKASAFSSGEKNEAGLSAEWQKYAKTPDATKYRMASDECPEEDRESREAQEKFGVCSFITKDIRRLKLTVLHTPSWNIAHSSIRGQYSLDRSDQLELRQELANLASVVLSPTAR